MNNLKSIRKEKGILQAEVATYLNVAVNTYARYEREDIKMDPDTLIKLSEFFNLSVDYIIGNTEVPLTLDEVRFIDDLKSKTDAELIDEYDLRDDDGKLPSKTELKKMLKIIRALAED